MPHRARLEKQNPAFAKVANLNQFTANPTRWRANYGGRPRNPSSSEVKADPPSASAVARARDKPKKRKADKPDRRDAKIKKIASGNMKDILSLAGDVPNKRPGTSEH